MNAGEFKGAQKGEPEPHYDNYGGVQGPGDFMENEKNLNDVLKTF